MKVILLQDVRKVGRKGEVKDISDGFATNMLLPKKLAEAATPAAIARIEAEKKKREAEASAQERALGNMIDSLRGAVIEVSSRATDKGGLFKSVDEEAIAKAIRGQKSLEIPEELITLKEPIRTTGKHTITLEYKTKKADLTVSVLPQ